jgi:Uma2 family endonuclease
VSAVDELPMKIVPTTKIYRGGPSHGRSKNRFAPANFRVGHPVPKICLVASKRRGQLWTDDELLAFGAENDTKYELTEGKLIAMPPAGIKHGAVTARLLAAIAAHVYQNKLGEVFDGQTGFRLSLDFCFSPDISFVSRERLDLLSPDADKLFHGAPDLAVEVLSPSDSIPKTSKKMALYLAHGTRLGWMIDLKNKAAHVCRANETIQIVQGDRMLTGNSVLPGFRVSLNRIFEGI